ncbi:hypothetical protein H1P_4810005 [Hyella patelloides LEGE 07179]|uniref:SF4 helicase domain-containing protein n=1 Tax=Hyella patelloides LEGE 07179 TaxID=945734 RepID=A0A563VZ88_9CYAN|nr:DnaB-like helicase C-terminal domain-containing protein [Hyella patelloides]VEP16687.1 hypothetical protein H1P_4810005 [Hyella patelloides LEGE 07179]
MHFLSFKLKNGVKNKKFNLVASGDTNLLFPPSRAVETRNDKRPMMSDLSQSGILEMVADNIIFAYRDEYYNPDTIYQNILELILAKARHGDTGKIELLFDKSCGMIENLRMYERN